jgi:hypothetical protein
VPAMPLVALAPLPAVVTPVPSANAAVSLDPDEIDEAYLWCVVPAVCMCTLTAAQARESWSNLQSSLDPDTDKLCVAACSPIAQVGTLLTSTCRRAAVHMSICRALLIHIANPEQASHSFIQAV